VSTFLERIYYDYDHYARPGVLEAILFRRSTTIFIIIERHLAPHKPLATRSQRAAAEREKGSYKSL